MRHEETSRPEKHTKYIEVKINGMYGGVRYGNMLAYFFVLFLSRGTYSYRSIGAGTACIVYYSVHTLYLQSSFIF